ncbi:MAG: GNAT family N-acetyltransferase [Anaerolineales bacterium]|nr:GNAT family N-acetyltransferase [Anaerolineales bacterium]
MTDGKVSLRQVQDGDLPILYEYQRDPEAVRMAAFPAREHADFMAHWAKVHANPENIHLAILLDGQVVGSIMSWVMEGQREVGYWVGRAFWGRGVASEALRQLLAQLLERPLYAHTARHNYGSMRVLEKCGFARVGQSKGVLNVDGELVEEIVFRLD